MWNHIVTSLRRLALAMLLCGASGSASAAGGSVYTLAVNPSAPPVTMNKLWTPFVDRLARETGLEFRLKHYERMAEFERDIWSGEPDFIFSSPIQLMVAHTSNGYVPLVRGVKPVAIGLFVRKDSPIKTIDDLVGKKISFVGNKNICSVFMQHLLAHHKKDLAFETEYAGSTKNVLINVLLGKSDAGSVFLPSMAQESEETRGQLREVVTTPEIAPHPLSAHPRVPQKDRELVTKATLAIAASPDGAELLKRLSLAAPVTADYARDYRALDEIDVTGLTNWGK